MPRLTVSAPKYRRHKVSGQAVVHLNGRDFYLGPYGSKASRLEYDRLIGEWITNGRQFPLSGERITVLELIGAFWRHAQRHYVKNGRPTDELAGMKVVLRYLRDMYSEIAVDDFRPLSLRAIREQMIQRGNSRRYVNQNVSRIKHIFKWGVSRELVPVAAYQALATLEGLRAGKSDARESFPVLPVENSAIDALLPYLRPVVADMVRLQRLTGMRPGEVCLMRPGDVDRSGDVWQYRPTEHKMEHKGRGRVILLGPKAQAIISQYLLRDATMNCFVRTVSAYRKAIHRACDRAGIDRWQPNQLRHAAATDIRKRFGLEAAQVTLGHAMADVTQLYAERDLERAALVALAVG